jgi:pimeloyl-ACP methyl ester carboxylesterase
MSAWRQIAAASLLAASGGTAAAGATPRARPLLLGRYRKKSFPGSRGRVGGRAGPRAERLPRAGERDLRAFDARRGWMHATDAGAFTRFLADVAETGEHLWDQGPLVGHRLHVHCTGKRGPTVVVESGFDEFSFDWALVQLRVSTVARICTYDRAGHAWSDPGPRPRTLDQITLELRDALGRLGEAPPFVLVGHSFGGAVVRHFASIHPDEVAGVVLVDSVQQDQRVVIQGRAVRVRASAEGRPIPPPRESLLR